MSAIISSIQFKRGNKSALEASLVQDQKPLRGEPVWEIDTNKLKIGDGIHDYVDLPYVAGGDKQQIVFDSRYEFPSVGEEDILYIAKDENNAYIWSTTKLAYTVVSVDNREIDGGSASSF